MLAISIDGELVDREHATISVLDRGLLYGDGLFEVFRGDDVQPHLDRLYASAAQLELRVMPRAALAEAIARTIAAAGQGEHRVRVIVTRGPGALSARARELGPGRAIVIVEPLPAQPRELSAVTIDRRWSTTGAGMKTLAYLDHVIARELAAAAGADEAIRTDADGNVVECATSNLFAVISGAVVTPPLTAGVLPGITRGHVLAICAQRAIPASEATISSASLAAADELFATSALRGVVPITRLDGAARAAGPVTARIAQAYAGLFHRR